MYKEGKVRWNLIVRVNRISILSQLELHSSSKLLKYSALYQKIEENITITLCWHLRNFCVQKSILSFLCFNFFYFFRIFIYDPIWNSWKFYHIVCAIFNKDLFPLLTVPVLLSPETVVGIYKDIFMACFAIHLLLGWSRIS